MESGLELWRELRPDVGRTSRHSASQSSASVTSSVMASTESLACRDGRDGVSVVARAGMRKWMPLR